MKQLVEAVLKVMDDCKGIEKSLNVGSGRSSYKGVSDKDVKLKVGESMRKHGLVIFPTGIQSNAQLNQWEEEDSFSKSNPKPMKRKQSIFTEVITTYKLVHTSGESIDLFGYGHGVDSQDKSAGKATTYALKYTLLYSFMVATGHIDDADNVHSDEIQTPKQALRDVSKEMLLQLKDSIADGKTKKDHSKINASLNKKGFRDLTDKEYKEIAG